MSSCLSKPIAIALGQVVVLCFAASTARADLFTWDNSCGDSQWHTYCDFWDGDTHYTDNNWDVGWEIWPDWPPLAGAADDASASGYVILDGGASVNSFSFGSGTFELQGMLSVATTATYNGTVDWLSGGFGEGQHDVYGALAISDEQQKTVHGIINCHAGAT
jgi:hypothetical protein